MVRIKSPLDGVFQWGVYWPTTGSAGDFVLKLSHDQNKRNYFPLNPGWLIGIRIIVYSNPYVTG